MFSKSLIGLLLLPLAAIGYANDRWIQFYDTDNGSHFYDPKTQTKNSIWTKVVVKPELIDEMGFAEFRSKSEANCQSNEVKVSNFIIYDKRHMIMTDTKIPDQPYEVVTPDTMGEATLNIICK